MSVTVTSLKVVILKTDHSIQRGEHKLLVDETLSCRIFSAALDQSLQDSSQLF